MADSYPPGSRWITTENGNHVLIDGDGRILEGLGGGFDGQTLREAFNKPSETSNAPASNGLSSNYSNDGRSSVPTDSTNDTPTKRQSKIDSVHIDFEKDNTLPGLNKKDLDDLGREDKPVLLKKEIIERNLHEHPEVPQEEYGEIIKGALYDGDLRFKGKSERHNQDYMNFVKTIPHSNSLVLLQLAEYKDNYEIVHLFKVGDRNLKRLQKK